MRYARYAACAVYLSYLLAALIIPQTMYVDRYLLRFRHFSEWAVVQLLPSMYTTEILITDLSDGKKSSVPHHPARMFWLNYPGPRCEAYNISVTYRKVHGDRDFLLCNDRLSFDKRTP